MRPLQLSCTAPRCSVRSIYTRGVHGVVCLLCSVGAPPAALERSSVKNSLNAAAGTASPLPESPAEQPPAPRSRSTEAGCHPCMQSASAGTKEEEKSLCVWRTSAGPSTAQHCCMFEVTKVYMPRFLGCSMEHLSLHAEVLRPRLPSFF